jgi:hypothetical protein
MRTSTERGSAIDVVLEERAAGSGWKLIGWSYMRVSTLGEAPLLGEGAWKASRMVVPNSIGMPN